MKKHRKDRLPIEPGTRFGRWTYLRDAGTKYYPSGNRQRIAEAQCDCGHVSVVEVAGMRRGTSTQCATCQRTRRKATAR